MGRARLSERRPTGCNFSGETIEARWRKREERLRSFSLRVRLVSFAHRVRLLRLPHLDQHDSVRRDARFIAVGVFAHILVLPKVADRLGAPRFNSDHCTFTLVV